VRVAPDLLERGPVVFGARQLEELAGVGEAAADATERADDGLQGLLLFSEFLGALRIVPELRVLQLAL
jgi:hypothetical protein